MTSTWTFQNSAYELHKTSKSLNQAAQAANTAGSYLVEINSEEENHAVFTQISTLISASEFSSTTSQDEIGSGSTASRPSLYHEANGEAVHLEMNPTEELIKMG